MLGQPDVVWGSPFRFMNSRLGLTAAALAVSFLCLHSIDSLTISRTLLSESDRSARNETASRLYAELASLEQPSTTSDITHALHDFVRQNSLVSGVSVFDNRGRLIVQLGNGNDSLLDSTAMTPSPARIPIESAGSGKGYALLSFRNAIEPMKTATHYGALALASVMLTMLIVTMLSTLVRLLLALT